MENVPLDNVTIESDSSKDAVPSQRPQVEEMEEEVKEGKPPPPPAVMGMGKFRAALFFCIVIFFAEVCSSVFFFVFFQTETLLLGAGLSIMKLTIKSGCFSSLRFISFAFISLLFSSPSKHPSA